MSANSIRPIAMIQRSQETEDAGQPSADTTVSML